MEDGKKGTVIFTNYQSEDDLQIGTREIKTVEFHKSELNKIPSELLDHQELENVIFNECRFTDVKNLEKLNVCPNITRITMTKCHLQTFPEFLSQFYTLNSLNVSENSFEKGSIYSITNLKNLHELDLSRCTLPAFPQVLCDLKSLEELDIGWNEKIQNLPEALENLTNLETLNVSRCGLTEFPPVLCNLKSLKELHIGGNNKIQNLPRALENLTNLETLKGWKCGRTEFPQVLCNLKSLKELDIGRNHEIKNLPGTLENLTNLETLGVLHCGLTEFPRVLCNLKSLKKLNIGWNKKIENLPEASKNLTNLETLKVWGCDLLGFPQVLYNLKSLKELDIGGNPHIKNLPGTLKNLTNLETLNVSNCGLVEFPQVLCSLKSLKELDLKENHKIKNLPGALENLKNLETLDMWGCDLLGFPQVLCNLKSLKELDIGGNRHIKNLPGTLKNLTNLETLNISNCDLVEFPQVLCKLKSLQYLDFSANPIARLPQWIEKCRCLEELDISNTKIKELPTAIFKMKNLSKVAAKYVQIEVLNEDFVRLWLQRPDIFTQGQFQKMAETLRFVEPPNEIVQRGPESCLRYYRALRVDNAVNCSMLNVIVMGETGAGKSSLIQSIKNGYSVLVDPLDRTVVVDTLEVKHEDVVLTITDFGGHDVYQITCPLFLKSTKQVAIVAVKLPQYSEGNHSELVKKWLTTAASHMKSGSIGIVATQCDLCSEEEVIEKMKILKREVDNWTAEESSFSNKLRFHQQRSLQKSTSTVKKIKSTPTVKKVNYFQTSSLNMKGIKEVEEFLFAEAKLSRSVIPKRWSDVYKKMDEETDKNINFITKSLYQTLFRKNYIFPQEYVTQKGRIRAVFTVSP